MMTKDAVLRLQILTISKARNGNATAPHGALMQAFDKLVDRIKEIESLSREARELTYEVRDEAAENGAKLYAEAQAGLQEIRDYATTIMESALAALDVLSEGE